MSRKVEIQTSRWSSTDLPSERECLERLSHQTSSLLGGVRIPYHRTPTTFHHICFVSSRSLLCCYFQFFNSREGLLSEIKRIIVGRAVSLSGRDEKNFSLRDSSAPKLFRFQGRSKITSRWWNAVQRDWLSLLVQSLFSRLLCPRQKFISVCFVEVFFRLASSKAVFSGRETPKWTAQDVLN